MKQAIGMTTLEFERLFKENFERLYYHAYDFVHDEDVAKDVVSDVFVNVWQLRDTIDMNRVLSYLYTSVRNRCIDHLGRNKRLVPLIDEIAGIMDTYEDNQWEEHEHRIRELRHQLNQLPERARNVLMMRFYEQKSNQEVAEMLGITIDGVKKIVQRTFAQLRISLDEKMLNFVLLLILVSID